MRDEKIYPLSSSQREIWFDQALHQDIPLYNLGGYSRIDGPLQPERLERAVNLVAAHHDALRIVLEPPATDDLPCQRFKDPSEIRVPFYDLSNEKRPHEKALSWMEAQTQSTFSLYGHALFEFALLKISPSRHYLFKRYHHIIVDGWGTSLIEHSLAAAYNALDGTGPDFPKETYSYAKFIEDDTAYLDSERFQKDEAYWIGKYTNVPEPLVSPHLSGMKAGGISPSRRRTFHLQRSFYDKFANFARGKKVSVFHVILGALYGYFTRIAQRDEFIIGLPVLNRRGAAFKKTVGLFTGIIPARFSFGMDLDMDEVLGRIASGLRQDYRSQRYPISDLNRRIGLHRTGRRQIFDVNLSYEKHDYAVQLGDARALSIAVPNQYSQDPLSIYIREFHAAEDVAVDFDYNLGYFTDEEMKGLEERFVWILESMLERSNRPIKTFPIMPDRERDLVLSEFNRTDAAFPEDKTVVDLFEAQAKETPGKVALVFEDQQMTYGELNARANQLAHYLLECVPGDNPLMGICVERSLEMVVGTLGILKAGGAYVPMDPAYPKERLAFMLEDSGVKVLLTQEALLGDLPDHHAHTVCLDRDWAKIGDYPEDNPEQPSMPENLAYVIYTSGSTGRPKGVMVEHCNVMTFLCGFEHIAPSKKPLKGISVCPFSFDVSVWDLFSNLCFGGELHIISTDMIADATLFSRYLVKHAVNSTYIPPALLTEVATQLKQTDSKTRLDRILVGVEPIPQGTLQKFRSLSETMRVINGYGPTETTVCATFFAFSAAIADEKRTPIGTALLNDKVYVVDQALQPVPIGVPGEILIGGSGVARGYLNQEALTKERFIEIPVDGVPTRVYRTGDLARWLPDGNLEYLGRMDHQVKLRGFRIELGEIESTLMEHAQVREAVVILLEEETNPRLSGFVTLKDEGDHPPDPATVPSGLREHLKRSLPDYMVPASVTLLSAMPLTPNGKIDRKALPSMERIGFERNYAAPRNETEEKLAALWAEILGLERVGIHDNFFELGGHSILALRVLHKTNQMFQTHFPPAVLFEEPTLSGLAEFVERAQKSSAPGRSRSDDSSNREVGDI